MHRGSVSSIRESFSSYGNDVLLTAPSSPVKQNIMIHQADIANNSGSDAALGYGYQLINSKWAAGQWDDSSTGTEFTDDTTDAQDAGTNDFAITTTTNNDGCIISASEPFDMVGFTVSTAEVGSPVYEYAYWNGSAWTTFTPIVEPDFTASETAIVFGAFNDWAVAAGSGTTAAHYAIRIRATTAPSTAPLAAVLWTVKMLDLVGVVSTGSTVNKIQYVNSSGMKIPTGHNLVPYCSVADVRNVAYFEYSYL